MIAYLCIARVGVEYVAEELTCHRDASYDEAVYVIRIDNKSFACCFAAQLGHTVKVDEEGEEDFVRGRAVFDDAKEVGFERDGGDITGVESEG